MLIYIGNMFSDVVLIHRPGGQSRSTLADVMVGARDVYLWQTCLRQIAVLDAAQFEQHDELKPAILEGDTVHRGDDAYRFLLEVICGLHSPLIGETEVYGQFKTSVASFQVPATPWGQQLKRFFKALFEDAKGIRQMHLEDLGSQSYGSVVRRELKGVLRIDIVGAGQLAREILPWISKDGIAIRMFVRDPEKVRAELGRDGIEVRALGEVGQGQDSEALIIAAPLEKEHFNQWLSQWLGRGMNRDSRGKVIVDLRADSAVELSEREGVRTLALAHVFERISGNQELLADRKAIALKAINSAVRERSFHVEYRPFGWEDVCA